MVPGGCQGEISVVVHLLVHILRVDAVRNGESVDRVVADVDPGIFGMALGVVVVWVLFGTVAVFAVE